MYWIIVRTTSSSEMSRFVYEVPLVPRKGDVLSFRMIGDNGTPFQGYAGRVYEVQIEYQGDAAPIITVFCD